MASKGQRKVGEVMGMYLRFISACTQSLSAYLLKVGGSVVIPVLITHCKSSLTLMHWLASSNSKSCKSSMRLAYSGSFFRLRLRLRASHSGSGRAVDEPEMV